MVSTQAQRLRGGGTAQGGPGPRTPRRPRRRRSPRAGAGRDRAGCAGPARVGCTQRTRRPGAALGPAPGAGLASYAANMAEALPLPRPRPGPARAALALPLRRPPASGTAGLQAVATPPARPPSSRRPGGHPLTSSRARRALGFRQVPEQVHGGGWAVAGLADAQPASGGGPHTRRQRAPHRRWRQRPGGGGPCAVNQQKAGPRRHQSARGEARPPQSPVRERGGAARGRGAAVRTRAGAPPLGARGADAVAAMLPTEVGPALPVLPRRGRPVPTRPVQT